MRVELKRGGIELSYTHLTVIYLSASESRLNVKTKTNQQLISECIKLAVVKTARRCLPTAVCLH